MTGAWSVTVLDRGHVNFVTVMHNGVHAARRTVVIKCSISHHQDNERQQRRYDRITGACVKTIFMFDYKNLYFLLNSFINSTFIKL